MSLPCFLTQFLIHINRDFALSGPLDETPRMLTIKTLRRVNTEHLATFRADPSIFFVFDELPYADLTLAFTIVSQFSIRHMITSYRNFFEEIDFFSFFSGLQSFRSSKCLAEARIAFIIRLTHILTSPCKYMMFRKRT